MTGQGAPAARPLRAALFVVFMLALTVLFAGLGVWQWLRLGEKEALIATVADRLDDPPIPVAEIGGDPDYRPVSLSGTYKAASTVLVFTSLSQPRGAFSGPGYWIMTALVLDDARGTVFVNRGFVPQDRRAEFTGDAVPAGHQQLIGIARAPEPPTGFTPESDQTNDVDWVRNPRRLAVFAGDVPEPLLPFTIDLPAGAPGDLPQGGETVITFPNNHLGYALTWFGFALLSPILLIFWLFRQRKP